MSGQEKLLRRRGRQKMDLMERENPEEYRMKYTRPIEKVTPDLEKVEPIVEEVSTPRSYSSDERDEPIVEPPRAPSKYLSKAAKVLEKSSELHDEVFGEGMLGSLKSGYVKHVGDDESTLSFMKGTPEEKYASTVVGIARQLSDNQPGLGTKFVEGATSAYVAGKELQSAVRETPDGVELKQHFDFEFGGKRKKKTKKQTKKRKKMKNKRRKTKRISRK
jgi:hypothetical protein